VLFRSRVRVRIAFSDWLVGCYAHVFVLLSNCHRHTADEYSWRKMEAAAQNRAENGEEWSVAYVKPGATRLSKVSKHVTGNGQNGVNILKPLS